MSEPKPHKTQSESKSELVEAAEAAAFPELDESILAVYEVSELIGEGGFGRVYKARHKQSTELVAIKVVRPDISNNANAVKRLFQEARAIATLNHERIVEVKEFGTGSRGSSFLVMRFIEGEPLDSLMRRVKLSQEQIIEIALQTAEALSYAHSKGILHRDLKPSNIMIESGAQAELQVKLVDFGIAKIADEGREQNLTSTGDIVGSPLYMSPEQCQGFLLKESSDIYSFGCVLYEMICGRTPFRGDNPMQTLLQHLNHPPKTFAQQAPDRVVSRNLELLVFKMLEKDPVDRYQNAAELIDDLLLCKQGKNIQAAKKAVKKQQAASSKPSRLPALFLTLLLIAAAGIFLSFQSLTRPPWLQAIVAANSDVLNGNVHLAKSKLRQAIKLAENAKVPAQDLCLLYGKLGNLCRDQDSFAEAADYYENAVNTARSAGLNAELAEYLDYLALCRLETGALDQALANANESLKLKLSLYGENHFFTSNILQKLGKIKYTQADYKGAEEAFKQAYKITEQLGKDQIDLAVIDWMLCRTYLAQDKRDEAKAAFERCISCRDELMGPLDATTKIIKEKYKRFTSSAGPQIDSMLISPAKEPAAPVLKGTE